MFYFVYLNMDKQIIESVEDSGLDKAALLAFITVETGGAGFAGGKLIIQFEPSWFRKTAPYAPSGKWSVNKVDVQSKEWAAFNDAFALNPEAAMKSTSIGLGQIMGFHYKRLGFNSVGEMWDDAKKGLKNQVNQLVKFIKTDSRLLQALNQKDWHKLACGYNGSGYRALAAKLGREPYDISLKKAYDKWKD